MGPKLFVSHRYVLNQKQKNALAQSIAGATLSTTEVPPTETVPAEITEATLPLDENTPYLQQLDIRALQEINSDVIGWIYIPNTQVNYPLLYTNDNSTYLYTTWEGEYNAAGSIFLEAQCSSNLKDFNTIIYGHNMRNGSMFATLHLYRDYSYYKSHPYIYIATNDTIYRYEVFIRMKPALEQILIVCVSRAMKKTSLGPLH